jgi:hypothetical protein
MRIGIDFDNTIACYDGVFYNAAIELSLIPADLPTSKNAVRDYLNNSGRSDEFTKLQGHVYGARMDLVACYPGVRNFIFDAGAAGHTLYVVSHKTKHPILGPPHDMHSAARKFLVAQDLIGSGGFDPDSVFFALTKEEKVAQVSRLDCHVFIDDLPDVLSMPGFPAALRAILFDPNDNYVGQTRFERHLRWDGIAAALLGSRQ